MRQIKFRAWNGSRMIMPEDKCYYQHYLSFCGGIVQRSSEGMSCFGGGDNWYVVNDLKLMQFTGLKDKNGVDIYEGDIVKMFYQDWLDKTEVIKFKDGTFGYGGEFHFSPFHCLAQDMRDARYHFSHAFEVIGNIHQNPELLK